MERILLTVAYDGTNYCGWQRQINGITVQERLEKTLSKVFCAQVSVAAASRTDAGVHARGQRAAFSVSECKIPLEKLCAVINGYLPEDIILRDAQRVDDMFNPRFAAREKLYIYRIYNEPYKDPLWARYSWHVPQALELESMADAAAHFVGTHDFVGFCAAGGSAKTTVRTIYSADVSKNGPVIEISLRGNGFLYNMVRIIAGTLTYAGSGKINPESLPEIIASCDRTKAGRTAPALGLCLECVEY